jgi:hypothetical protein
MTEQHQAEKPDLVKYIGLGFLAGLIVAVLALEYYGYIKHATKEDSLVVEDLRLLSLNTAEEIKVSPKDSGKEAFCVNGYLLVRPQNGKNVAGVLVDKKNRGINCQADLSRTNEIKD